MCTTTPNFPNPTVLYHIQKWALVPPTTRPTSDSLPFSLSQNRTVTDPEIIARIQVLARRLLYNYETLMELEEEIRDFIDRDVNGQDRALIEYIELMTGSVSKQLSDLFEEMLHIVWHGDLNGEVARHLIEIARQLAYD